MNYIETEENIRSLFRDLVDKNPKFAASVATSAFVSVIQHLVELNGHNYREEIKINGVENRDITLHKIKEEINLSIDAEKGGK